ncbi:hypothetical protein [Pseudoalteromonas sp.]|uniref:hypothetical protein n=1 Tax=Pseudoalteromonas sp. TaxID=53249 RepID=UPI00356B1D9F
MEIINASSLINVTRAVVVILFLCCFYTTAAPAQSIVIVINTAEENLVLSKQQVRNIYMGGALSRKFKAIQFQPGNPLRVDFNTKVVGLTESRVQAYWAQMKFTGRSYPPVELSSINEVLEYLQRVDNAVGYLPAGIDLPSNLTVIELPSNISK